MASILRFITTKLKVNEERSAVSRPWERKFVGFSFTANRALKRRLASKAVIRLQSEHPGVDTADRHIIRAELSASFRPIVSFQIARFMSGRIPKRR